MNAATPPRRNWHLQRWLLLLAAGFLAYAGWTQYAFRAALKEAEALGLTVLYTDPVNEIRKNWRTALKKETWLDGVTWVPIPTSEQFEHQSSVIHRLNPKAIRIIESNPWRDLSAVKALTRLEQLDIWGGTNLINVDALKNLSRETLNKAKVPVK